MPQGKPPNRRDSSVGNLPASVGNWGDADAGSVLDAAGKLGTLIRYGKSDAEMLPEEAGVKRLPGMDESRYKDVVSPDVETREAAKHALKRGTSVKHATDQWGAWLPLTSNLLREVGQGLGTAAGGGKFITPGGINSRESDETKGFDPRALADAADVANAAMNERPMPRVIDPLNVGGRMKRAVAKLFGDVRALPPRRGNAGRSGPRRMD